MEPEKPEKPKKATTPVKIESKVTFKSELTENSIYIDPSKPVGKLSVLKFGCLSDDILWGEGNEMVVKNEI